MADLGSILATVLFVVVAGVQSATPLVLAAVGGSFSSQVNVFNLGLEGMMIAGAFAGFAASHATGSAFVGMVAGALAGAAVAGVFAVATVYFGTDEIITGFLLNLVMLALTAVLLTAVYGASGQIVSTSAGMLPQIGGGLNVMVPVAVVVVLWAHWYVYRTRSGLRIRAVGGNPAAANAAGVDVAGHKYRALIVGGVLAGLGGAYLPLAGLSMFTLGMTAGMGFIAVSAVLFGDGRPLVVGLAALLFGFMGAAAIPFQRLDLPSELALVLPYLVTIVAVGAKGVRAARRSRTVFA